VKFLLRQQVTDIKSLDEKVFRVYESFDYVFDIPYDKINDLKGKAEKMNMRIDILNSLPILYQNPYKDLYKIINPNTANRI
jgi:hypothetical protein